MLHTTALVDDRDFREHVLRDLELGCSVPGTPPVVAQLAGNDAQRLVEGGKVVAGSVDALGESSLRWCTLLLWSTG